MCFDCEICLLGDGGCLAGMRDDRKAWMECVNPKLHKMYDEIRRELMTVPFYRGE